MPYIPKSERAELDPAIEQLVEDLLEGTVGDEWDGRLNYAITALTVGVVRQSRAWRYSRIARVMGCLVCVMFEFYRRAAAPYEDTAIEKNGDLEEYR